MIATYTQLTVIIVGLTEVIKQAFNVSNKFLKILISFLIAAALTALVFFLGDRASPILGGLTAFASATLSYDIIVKRITSHGGNDLDNFDPDGDNSRSYHDAQEEGQAGVYAEGELR